MEEDPVISVASGIIGAVNKHVCIRSVEDYDSKQSPFDTPVRRLAFLLVIELNIGITSE